MVLLAIMIPDAIAAVRAEHKDVYHERARTVEINKLAATINSLGGYKRVLQCGQPVINVEYASIMAWYVHMNTGLIGYRPQFELTKKHNPIVLFTRCPTDGPCSPTGPRPACRARATSSRCMCRRRSTRTAS